MKNKLKIVILIIVVVFFLSSCLSIDIESKINDKIVSMTPLSEEIEHTIVGSFYKELRAYFTLNGLIKMSQLEIDSVIKSEIDRYNGDGVVNLRINDKFGGIDILIQFGIGAGGYLIGALIAPDPRLSASYGSIGVSIGQLILQSRTVTISGDIVKID